MTQTTPCSENEGLFLRDFSQFVVDNAESVRQQWWQSCDTFPDLGEPVPLSKQRENELAASRLIDTVSAALCTYAEQPADQLPWRHQLLQEIDSFVANHMGWPKNLRELAFSPDFFSDHRRFFPLRSRLCVWHPYRRLVPGPAQRLDHDVLSGIV